ncbi:Flagellar hook-associated protein FliD [plant metagenome]|uniref:Filament cap protein n=1 Tax=plant metagenome TaxID=1297885 RepID=A0A484SBL0_9ZZZZ
MAISNIGVGSGLPLDQLLADLRKNSEAPLTVIQNKQTVANARLSAYGVLKSSVEAVQKAAEALGKASTYGAVKVASNSTDTLTVTGSDKAIAGQYNVEITELAKAQSLVALGREDRTSNIGNGGVITFTREDGTTAKLDLSGKDTSLDAIVAAINADPSLGVNATLINDGSDSPHRLMLTASTTGTDASITSISVDGNADLQNLLGYDAADPSAHTLEQKTEALNAKLTINGIEITSQTNTVTDAVEGLTLTLNKKTSTDPVLVSATRDPSVATKAVTDFVNAYNNMNTNIRQLTSYNADDGQASVLTGDSVSRNIQSQMRSILDFSLPGTAVGTLAGLGITTNPASGALTVDNTKLEAALKANPSEVIAFFAGEDGLSARLKKTTESILNTEQGIISTAQSGAKRQVDDLKTQLASAEARIDSQMEVYRKQFLALDKIVTQMNATSNYLTQQLEMLSANATKKN